ncbi:VOC family protein [Leifsonia shinshuensis]|uniref:Catechol 2,3-dioxygenase-like lactoylglutathione lyase family enzyme n=1 Tax=Leifsonia shinshuensis TaxID=150026 RepID=A0A853CRB6_9MICO|nr:VOC family protein [Leifsonia shinshuensis]NYJ23227.1 catechol 2,3-dioxygenase-like lactoylglutathione lyase family enzyme [Leifsonia shinshuensis]
MTDAGIIGVNTIGIPVRDQDVALAFYRDVLGFELLVDAPLPTGGRWIMVAPPGSAVSVSLVVAGDDAPAGVETGIRFESLDAAGTHAELTRRGVAVGELLRWPGVPAMFQARDQDGNRFEVVERG